MLGITLQEQNLKTLQLQIIVFVLLLHYNVSLFAF